MVVTAHELPLMLPEAWAISPQYCDRLQDAVREEGTARLEQSSFHVSFPVSLRSEAGSSLQRFGIPCPLHCDLCSSAIDIA